MAEILGVIGGVGVILLVLLKFLGKIQINRIRETEHRESEISRVQPVKYLETQFDKYVELLSSLQAMELAVDLLWESASKRNIVQLSKALIKLRKEINGWSIFFEDKHLDQINRLLAILENFESGKKNLLEIREGDISLHFTYDLEDTLIKENQGFKEKFQLVLEEIKASFKKKLYR